MYFMFSRIVNYILSMKIIHDCFDKKIFINQTICFSLFFFFSYHRHSIMRNITICINKTVQINKLIVYGCVNLLKARKEME